MLPRAQDPAESSTTGMSARSGDLHNGARNVAENEIHKVASPTIAWSTVRTYLMDFHEAD